MLRGFPPFSSDAYTTGVLLSIRRDCRRTRRSSFFSPFVWEKTPTLHYSCTTLQLFNSSGLGSGPPDRKSIRTITAQRIPLYTTALNPKWCRCKMLIILVNQSWWGGPIWCLLLQLVDFFWWETTSRTFSPCLFYFFLKSFPFRVTNDGSPILFLAIRYRMTDEKCRGL